MCKQHIPMECHAFAISTNSNYLYVNVCFNLGGGYFSWQQKLQVYMSSYPWIIADRLSSPAAMLTPSLVITDCKRQRLAGLKLSSLGQGGHWLSCDMTSSLQVCILLLSFMRNVRKDFG